MWLLKTFGSNRMKHLIPYLEDDQKAADYLRQLRWPDGVTCPRCGSDRVEPRERCDNGREQGDAGGSLQTRVEWAVLFACHSNSEKPPDACQTATRSV